MNTIRPIPSVNYHLWKPCNMSCRFCFATFQDIPTEVLPKGHLGRDGSISVVESLAGAGFRKINFAGGEPTLCPWLPELINLAKALGFVTSVVTNGSRISGEWLDDVGRSLDWAAVSIDSLDLPTLVRTGRATASGPMSREHYLDVIRLLRERGIRVKINTVVTRDNLDEDLTGFIAASCPERWKLLQVLPVRGQNDHLVSSHVISPEEFNGYVRSARTVERGGVKVVAESNDLMTGSYAMVDPAGRFFDNTGGRHVYSRPIIEVGANAAFQEVAVDTGKFIARGGLYDW